MATTAVVCPRCEKPFRFPYLLRRHEDRRTPCDPILERGSPTDEEFEDSEERTCRFCYRGFSSFTSMRRHVRQSCRIAPTAKNGDAGMELLLEHTVRRQQAQIDQLTTLVGQMAGAKPNAGVSVNNVNHVGDNNMVKIEIHIHGQEDTTHITVPDIRSVLDAAGNCGSESKAAIAAFQGAARLIYSNPAHPENATCFLPNKKDDRALVRELLTDGRPGWVARPASAVLPKMGAASVNVVFDHQPPDAKYAPLLKSIVADEESLVGSSALRDVLADNKNLVAQTEGRIPKAVGRGDGKQEGE